MRFSQTHHMPYTGVNEPGLGWPIANRRFEADRGIALFRTYIDAKVAAEDCDFDAIGCNEHHMSPFGMMPNPNLIAAAVIERTRRAEILLSGNILPLLNPIRVAEEYAMLDVMSGGRLMAGFMRGIPHEYVAYNIAPDESWGRMKEAVALILKAWTEPEPFGWEGEFYQFRAVSIWPKPVQKPYPAIVMSGGSPRSARFAATHRAIMGILRVTNLDQAKELIDVYKAEAREAGWEPGSDRFMVGVPTSVAETFEEAKAQLEKGTRYFFEVLQGGINRAQQLVLQKTRFHAGERQIRTVGKDQELKSTPIEQRIAAGQILCGTPEMVVEQITKIHRHLDHGHMNLIVKTGNMDDDFVLRSMRLLKERVFPHVKGLVGAPSRPLAVAKAGNAAE
jgi:alkanesulfonate monooxygenase SsuD/methylene tetrahydromethanopterin reductase-like flavin-dependent oxidoreductase (luciferase family)